MMMAMTEVRYDVAAADGELIGTDVSRPLMNLIVGCLDGGPPLVRVHREDGTRPELWAALTAARCP